MVIFVWMLGESFSRDTVLLTVTYMDTYVCYHTYGIRNLAAAVPGNHTTVMDGWQNTDPCSHILGSTHCHNNRPFPFHICPTPIKTMILKKERLFVIAYICAVTKSFSPSRGIPYLRRPMMTYPPHHFPLTGTGLQSSTAFDFSAPSEWESYYKEHSEILEWHSSIPLDRIASYVSEMRIDQYDKDQQEQRSSPLSVLMVGCGNSRLPATFLSSCPDCNLVLLDTSQTCLDQLREVYGTSVEYVCGNAVQLDRLFGDTIVPDPTLHPLQPQVVSTTGRKFDMIIDKGLSDALFCSEGWNGPIEELYRTASTVLNPHGRYLLISYRLPSSTQTFLTEVGHLVNLQWEFHIPLDSNDRVGVSMAIKVGE